MIESELVFILSGALIGYSGASLISPFGIPLLRNVISNGWPCNVWTPFIEFPFTRASRPISKLALSERIVFAIRLFAGDMVALVSGHKVLID